MTMTKGEKLARGRAEMLSALVQHRENCPRNRIEKFAGAAGTEVVRCVDCGNQSVKKAGKWEVET